MPHKMGKRGKKQRLSFSALMLFNELCEFKTHKNVYAVSSTLINYQSSVK